MDEAIISGRPPTSGLQTTARIQDSSGNSLTSTSSALDVNIKSGNVTLNTGDIEIGAVELKNGSDDTRATVTAANALKVDGSAVTQPISAASLPLPTSAATEATLATRLSESDFDTKAGALTETAPTTDTASSGLNGRLQRIAQRLTSLIALVPTSLTSGGNFKVSIEETNVTQAVSGTVTANQGGTWTVQPGNTANTTAWKVDASSVAVPVTDNSGSLTVDGSVSVTQATGTNLHAVIDSGTVSTITNVVHVDDNSGSLTVDNSGTFAVQSTIAAGATNIAKAEDVASADADVGVPAMAIRKATPVNTSGTDGDYEMLQMSAGRLWASATIDAALPAGTNAIGKLAANDGVDIGDVTINNASGASSVNIQDGGNSITVDGTVTTSNLPTTVDTNSGNKSASTLRVVLATDQPQLTNKLLVTPDANSAVNIAQINGVATTMGNGVSGTGVQRVTIASDSTGQVIALGGTASGGSLTANPVTTGALARTTPPTAVANAQVVNLQSNIYGELIVRHALRETKGQQQTSIASSTSETTIVTADATYKLDLYGLILTNTSATGTKVTIKDSTAGTTRMILYVPATETRGFMLPASDGHKQNAANNNWTATCGTSVGNLEVTAMFVQNL